VSARYRVLAERLHADWQDARAAAQKARRFEQRAARGGPDAEAYLEAAALNLHGFYNGMEHIFEWLARELDDGVPQGSSWHRELLDQMALDVTGVRPPLLGAETRAALSEYLGFRHLVRNLYTWDFAPQKIHRLADMLGSTLDLLDADLTAFARFLTAADSVDDP
jgi:hypothetical protein